jgi:hypothetical protein
MLAKNHPATDDLLGEPAQLSAQPAANCRRIKPVILLVAAIGAPRAEMAAAGPYCAAQWPRTRAPHAPVRGSRPVRVAVPGADHDGNDRQGAARSGRRHDKHPAHREADTRPRTRAISRNALPKNLRISDTDLAAKREVPRARRRDHSRDAWWPRCARLRLRLCAAHAPRHANARRSDLATDKKL